MIKKNNLAIIPARGGSTRIPKKNIVDFCGKPMIAWTIDAAKKSKIFDRIIVGTDSQEIAKIALKNGAEVPFFRTEYVDNFTPVSHAVVSVYKQVKQILNEEYKTITMLLANMPLRTSEDITCSFNNFVKLKPPYQMSCFRFGWQNPWWAFELKNNYAMYLYPKALKTRSQDLPTLYCPGGGIWMADSKNLERSKNFYGKGHIFYEIDWKSAIDIDTIDDFEFAKLTFKYSK